MIQEFQVVYSCWSVEEAHLARIRLAAEGIDGHLADDQTIGMDWGLANSIRGVKVLVKEADASRAREILDSQPVEQSSAGTFDSEEWKQSHDGQEHSQSTDQVRDEEEEAGEIGTLGSLRSIKAVVIWLFLAPIFLSVLGLFAAMVNYFLQTSRFR